MQINREEGAVLRNKKQEFLRGGEERPGCFNRTIYNFISGQIENEKNDGVIGKETDEDMVPL